MLIIGLLYAEMPVTYVLIGLLMGVGLGVALSYCLKIYIFKTKSIFSLALLSSGAVLLLGALIMSFLGMMEGGGSWGKFIFSVTGILLIGFDVFFILLLVQILLFFSLRKKKIF